VSFWNALVIAIFLLLHINVFGQANVINESQWCSENRVE